MTSDQSQRDGFALVSQDLRAPLADFSPIELSSETLAGARMGMEQMAFPVPPGLPVAASDHHIRSADGHDILVRLYRPEGTPGCLPALLYIHGGGFVMGSIAMGEVSCRIRALEAHCVVAAVEYRLAPEHPHPAPLEDCYAALDWLMREAASLAIDPARIGVVGESAGGGLAAGLALLARDRGEHRLAFQHLIYPMLDDRTCTRSDLAQHLGAYVWTPQANCFGWTALIGAAPGGNDVSPYAAPARASDLAGLPPTFLYVGALDLFVDEDLDYARRLIHAAVPVELHVYPGAYHGFEIAPEAMVSKQAMRDSLAALKRALHPAE